MESLEFTLKLLSPAFIGGAMGREVSHFGKKPTHWEIGPRVDGLRIPSLRGMLRFWFRALNYSSDLAALKRREDDLFGSADNGQGLRIIPISQYPENWRPMLFDDEKGERCPPPIAYLGYGPIIRDKHLRRNTSHHEFAYREAIPPDTSFTFRAIGTQNQINKLKQILKIVHLFGGIGARPRRGWGALSVFPFPFIKNQADDDFGQWFINAFRNCLPANLTEQIPNYTAISMKTQIALFQPRDNDWQSVFWAFYNRLKKVRIWDYRNPENSPNTAKEDYKLAKKQLGTKQINGLPKRMGYGFPFKIQFRSSNSSVEYKAEWDNPKSSKTEEITRRASPLVLSICEDYRGQLIGVAAYLKSNFWGHAGVRVGTQTADASALPVSTEAVEEFMNISNNFRIEELFR